VEPKGVGKAEEAAEKIEGVFRKRLKKTNPRRGL